MQSGLLRELVIDSSDDEVVVALLENKKLVELHRERKNKNYSVGDIYIGKVKKLIIGLNAAFIDIGHEKDAFLHYLDLGPQINTYNQFLRHILNNKNYINFSIENFPLEKEIEKNGKISNVLTTGNYILVQIAKEPISTKGARVTSELTIAGRYLVLMPFSDKISVSQKIKNKEERTRLKKILQAIKPKNFGVIIRTVAENKSIEELDNDLKSLIEKWENGLKSIPKAKVPSKIIGELDRTAAIIRDILNDTFSSIIVNDQNIYEDIRQYLLTIAPNSVDILKLYKSKVPIFENFGIEKQIKTSFGKIVNLKSGAYLVIEHTEALHVIDVNSGHRLNSLSDQEKNAFDINCDAALEIARQIRLRDLGGIIVIDFIDMNEITNRKRLYDILKEAMKTDRAKHTILPPSEFGLVQITRQRVRPENIIENTEKCPCCDGTGEIKPSILFIEDIENNIKYLLKQNKFKSLKLTVHPFVYAYLKKGFINHQIKWLLKYKKWIKLNSYSYYSFLEYHFFDENDDEIKI